MFVYRLLMKSATRSSNYQLQAMFDDPEYAKQYAEAWEEHDMKWDCVGDGCYTTRSKQYVYWVDRYRVLSRKDLPSE